MSNRKGSSDVEDIPSDFFDDFAKDDFIEGLSVIDSWKDEDKKPGSSRSRINSATIESVRDLRELIVREANEVRRDKYMWKSNKQSPRRNSGDQRRSNSANRLDDYIKPGSRRDPNKTNEAIKKDKEEKVKEHLAKHLDSNDDLRPPGTELDDFFEGKKVEVRKRTPDTRGGSESPKERNITPNNYRREISFRNREFTPKYRHPRYSPRRPHFSPRRSPRRSPRFSPGHRRHFSPTRNYNRYPRHSPRRFSPVMRRRHSRSPMKHSYSRRSRSRSPRLEKRKHLISLSPSPPRRQEKDDFLYPNNYYDTHGFPPKEEIIPYQPLQPPLPQYTDPMVVEYPGGAPGYTYTQAAEYSGYTVPYEYGVQPAPPMFAPVPQPVPAPMPGSLLPTPTNVNPLPIIAPDSQHCTLPLPTNESFTTQLPNMIQNPPGDALAKLVADGTLSHADYLKLAPNKGVTHVMDTHTKAAVLSRCEVALSRLCSQVLPNQLLLNNILLNTGSDLKSIAPKFCSPLKRQASMKFHFTDVDTSSITQQNKEIVDTIIKRLNLEEIVERPKKKLRKGMKDAAVQTTRPFCDICEIRHSTKFNDVGTSIDQDQISSTVHTQVVDQDLISSNALFNPSGSIADGAPISIAHMTPSQLVSKLAARAKTLKQPNQGQPSNQFRSQPNNYDGRGGSSSQYGNNYNYRF